jgi:hypothetical protein
MSGEINPANYYPGMKFPDYRFVQFPEWVKPPNGGAPVLVENQADKDRVLAGWQDQVPETPAATVKIDAEPKALIAAMDVRPEPVSADAERAELLAYAEKAGIVIDKRWGLDRLREACNAPLSHAPLSKA